MSALIGLCGRSGAGKDEVARILGDSGFQRLAIADHLKAVAKVAFRLSDAQLWGAKRNQTDPRYGLTPRVLYQRLGDGLRAAHPSALLLPFFEELDARLSAGARVVVADVRLPEERDALRRRGAVIWRLERQVTREFDGHSHPTEVALDGVVADASVRNDGTLDDLRRAVGELLPLGLEGRR